MKKSELKSIIKECIKEILFEEGVLSGLVAEVAFGITKAQGLMVEQKQEPRVDIQAEADAVENKRKKLLETKRKMLDAMGNTKMKNVFEGTEPLRSTGKPSSSTGASPLSGRDPTDAGVDISGLFNVAGKKWNALK